MKAALKRIPGLRQTVRFLKGQPTQTAREYVLRKLPKRSVGVEIGVHEGDFAQLILDIVKPERLHLIDPWKHEEDEQYQTALYGGLGPQGQAVMNERYEKVKRRFAKEIRAGSVVIHRDYSNRVAETLDHHYVDWVYIDGNHLYEFVKQDLELYHPKVKPGGYLIGDDYGLEGWWDNGVQKAVDEFVTKQPGITIEIRGRQFICQKAK